MRHLPLLLAAALLAMPGTVAAHARLVSSTPAADAAVAPVAAIDLRFSEPLVGKLSGADLTPAAGGATRLPATVRVGADGRSLRLVLPRPLASGGYRVAYHVTSADTHRVTGGFSFRVK